MLYHRGIIYTLLSGLFFGLIGYFGINIIHSHISVYTMLFWRFFVSGLFVFCLLIPGLRRIKIESIEWFKVFIYGVVFYGTCSILYFIAAEYIGSGLAMVIFFTYPVFVMLLNQLVYKFPFSWIYLFSLVIILIGMTLLIKGGEFSFIPLGIILSILASLLYAFYILFSKKSLIEPILSTLSLSLGCMFISLIAALIDHSFLIPSSGWDWFNIFGIGIICTALPILLLLLGLKQISATQASILSVLEPVFVVLFGLILLGEQVTLQQGVGVAVILSGSLLSILQDIATKPSPH